MPDFATRQDFEALRQDLRVHVEDDRDFQERMFKYLEKRFDKLDKLWDRMNIEDGQNSGKNKIFGMAGAMLSATVGMITAYATVKMLK